MDPLERITLVSACAMTSLIATLLCALKTLPLLLIGAPVPGDWVRLGISAAGASLFFSLLTIPMYRRLP